MAPTTLADYSSGSTIPNVKHEVNASGVSWPAVLGGAAVAAALSLILLSLGTGLGLSSITPWANSGASSSTVKGGAILWLILMQIIASAMGGYLAGRLRTKWPTIHSDEVYFRDTAHGFLAWAVATIVTAAFLASAALSMVGGSSKTSAGTESSATATAATAGSEGGTAYFVDMLLRSDHPTAESYNPVFRSGVERALAHSLKRDDNDSADSAYLAEMVTLGTGLSSVDASKRVSEVTEQARQAADKARKAAAHLSLWLFVGLLSGAFFASFSATIGGRQRDNVKLL